MNLFPNILRNQIIKKVEPEKIELNVINENTKEYHWNNYTLSVNESKKTYTLNENKRTAKVHKKFAEKIIELYLSVNQIKPIHEEEFFFKFNRSSNAKYEITSHHEAHKLKIIKKLETTKEGKNVHIQLAGIVGNHGFATGDTFHISEKVDGFNESVKYKVNRITSIYYCCRYYKDLIDIDIKILANKI